MTTYTSGPVSLSASEGPVEVIRPEMSRAGRHEIVVQGQAQADLYVAGQTSPAQTVTASTGSPVIVNLSGVTKIELTETGAAAAVVTMNGR